MSDSLCSRCLNENNQAKCDECEPPRNPGDEPSNFDDEALHSESTCSQAQTNKTEDAEDAEEYDADEVTEVCPSCGDEITLQWRTKVDGYKAYCPHCGQRLMLCDACLHEGNGECSWNDETDSCKFSGPAENAEDKTHACSKPKRIAEGNPFQLNPNKINLSHLNKEEIIVGCKMAGELLKAKDLTYVAIACLEAAKLLSEPTTDCTTK